MLLLGDATQFMDLLVGQQSTDASNGSSSVANGTALFETLMKALTGEPDKIRDAAQVVDELSKSEEGRSKLPEGFHAIWDPIEPDLVILDEFQRFKDLLGGELDEPSGAAELAHQLFSYREDKSNPDTQARVLLLSATPYKMYTMHQERETDNHYSDFQSTLRFLMPKTEQADSVAASIQDYRERLWSIGIDNGAGVFAAKLTLEEKLRSVMTRTERLASSADRSGMLVESDRMKANLAQSDVEHFMALKDLTELVESRSTFSRISSTRSNM
jgi:hypothetical protein